MIESISRGGEGMEGRREGGRETRRGKEKFFAIPRRTVSDFLRS